MADSWHIPRASLGSISSGSRHSNSRRSSVVDINTNRTIIRVNGNNNNNRMDELRERFDNPSSINQKNHKNPSKRGSRSSQGSSDSAHSSQSAGSGSLLLTAANLENFARIHNQHQKQHHQRYPPHSIQEEEQEDNIRPYHTNITLGSNASPPAPMSPKSDSATIDIPHSYGKFLVNGGFKTKDLDTISMASSTHFTVVNGIGRQPKVPKSGLCDRGHQITVLIVTMSIFFMIGICAAIYFMESKFIHPPFFFLKNSILTMTFFSFFAVRAREMPY